MSQEQSNMIEGNPQISIFEVQDKGLNNWQTIIESNSQKNVQQNQQAPVFSSEGKWSFQIKRRQFSGIDQPVIELIKEDFGLQEDDLEIEQKNDVTNIKQALEIVGLSAPGITEEQWSHNYEFWAINNFRIDVKDGNTTIVDFKNQSHHFVLFYETSLKNHTHANQNQ